MNFITREHLVLFVFSFAVLFGPAFALFDTYDFDMEANPDIATYLGLAEFDFDQSPVRRYRVIIPFLASGVNAVFHPVFSALAPHTYSAPDFSLCMSFLLVNSFLMAVFGVLVYRLTKAFGADTLGAIVGLLSVLTCRWTAYIAGIPCIDSLYLVVAALMLLGIREQKPSFLIICIFLGPWAKESFIFLAPLIFFFAPIRYWKQVGYFLLSGVLVFTFRYLFDHFNGFSGTESLSKDLSHVDEIGYSLRRLFSFHGAYEVFSIVGFWGVLFLLMIKKDVRMVIKNVTPPYMILYIGIVILHALLSTELARMFYLATPVVAVWLATIFTHQYRWLMGRTSP